MQLYQPKSQLKGYLLFLVGGLVMLGGYYVPGWLGAYDGQTAQWYSLVVAALLGIPGFILALIGVVGIVIETIKIVVLKAGKKI